MDDNDYFTGEKITYFQAITGIQDPDLCVDILQAHDWDLELAVSSFTSPTSVNDNGNHQHVNYNSVAVNNNSITGSRPTRDVTGSGLAWKLMTLPFYVISGSLGLLSGAIGFGLRVTGGVLSYSLGAVGLGSIPSRNSDTSLISVSSASREAMDFVSEFDRVYGSIRPNFVADGFMDAMQRSRNEFKLLLVYLHAPDHPDTSVFCERTLCSEVVSAFVNENFVAWGASVRGSEGFKMSNSFNASNFPFCALIMPSRDQTIALIQQVEGPTSAEEMLTILQNVLEESAPVLLPARLDAEERISNMHIREEQDAAYRAALEADQARERQQREEQERIEREAVEAEKKSKEDEEARERAAREAADREAALARLRQKKALSLGAEPENGPEVTQVLVRFPNGERKGRRFHNSAAIQSLYDFIDSLGWLEDGKYNLVSNFPRTTYGSEKLLLTLKEVGLHPQASLFVELK